MARRAFGEQRDGYFMMPKEDMFDKLRSPSLNIRYLIEKIEEVSPNHLDHSLYEAANTFKNVCVSLGVMRDVMLTLHSKAMNNPKFGEKYITVLEQLSNHIVDNVPVRSELLSFIENDFQMKETMFQTDSIKFINAVMLLGNVYNHIKIHGVPLKVLAGPMLDYLNLLIEGGEDHHRVLAIQVLLNGDKIFRSENLGNKISLLKQGLRGSLITRELTPKSKCWILLAMDYISNGLKPLSADLVHFYVEALGYDFLYVSHLVKPACSERENTSENERKKSVTRESLSTDTGDVFKDIENATIPPEVLTAARINRFPRPRPINSGIVLNEREERNSHPRMGRELLQGDHDEDDLYGLQIERERIRKLLNRRN